MYNIMYGRYAYMFLPRRFTKMPLYEYRCTVCGHRFELLRSIAERDSAVCVKCGGKVGRVWQGSCAFGAPKSGCSGNCAGCHGCGGRKE